MIVLLVQTERERDYVMNTVFAVCGDNLCYQYPNRAVVNIINIEGLNKQIAKERKEKLAREL